VLSREVLAVELLVAVASVVSQQSVAFSAQQVVLVFQMSLSRFPFPSSIMDSGLVCEIRQASLDPLVQGVAEALVRSLISSRWSILTQAAVARCSPMIRTLWLLASARRLL
jgi:hypothetical protein